MLSGGKRVGTNRIASKEKKGLTAAEGKGIGTGEQGAYDVSMRKEGGVVTPGKEDGQCRL